MEEGNNSKVLYVDPWAKSLIDNKLFTVDVLNDVRKDYLLPFVYLANYCRQHGITILTADKLPNEINSAGIYLYYSFGQLEGYRKIKDRKNIKWGSFYLFEPPIKVLPKKNDINYELSVLAKTFKRVYTTSPVEAINHCYNIDLQIKTNHFCYPQSHNGPIDKFWNNSNRKLLVMVNSYRYSRLSSYEFYSERINALKYFLPKNLIDLYGNDWNKLSTDFIKNGIIALLWAVKWKSFRRLKDLINAFTIRKYLRNINGSPDKYYTLSNYRFAICYESMSIEGFITEKIFDCFFAGTIPIYLGAPDITKRIPKDTFIDKRDFNSYDDLTNFIYNISQKQYESYRDNIKKFLISDEFEPFTMKHFAEQFLADVIKDLNGDI